ncbi:MAG: WxL domain-containing protein [Sporolactobacillus sp.]
MSLTKGKRFARSICFVLSVSLFYFLVSQGSMARAASSVDPYNTIVDGAGASYTYQVGRSKSTGTTYTYFLRSDGTLWQIEKNYYVADATPLQIGTENDWVAIYQDSYTSGVIAKKADGSLWTVSAPSTVTLLSSAAYNYVNFKGANGNDYFVKSDGTLWAFGKNTNYATMGTGNAADTLTGMANAVEISATTDWLNCKIIAAPRGTLVLKADGTVWGWGSTYGTAKPTQIVSGTNWADIMAFQSDTYLLDTSGNLYGFGTYLGGSSSAPVKFMPYETGLNDNPTIVSIGGAPGDLNETIYYKKQTGPCYYGSTTTELDKGTQVDSLVTPHLAGNRGAAYPVTRTAIGDFITNYPTLEYDDGTLWGSSYGPAYFELEYSDGTLFSLTAPSVPAGSPTATQTASVSVTAGNFGVTPLSSMINLGSIAPSSTALAAGSDIQVDDERGTGAGWHLMVSAPQLQNAAGQKLPSGSLMLQDPSIAVVGDSASTYPLLQVNQFLVDTGSSTEVASAAVGTGMGSYKIGFDHADSARLTVPASTYAGTYSTALTWQLVSGP